MLWPEQPYLSFFSLFGKDACFIMVIGSLVDRVDGYGVAMESTVFAKFRSLKPPYMAVVGRCARAARTVLSGHRRMRCS